MQDISFPMVIHLPSWMRSQQANGIHLQRILENSIASALFRTALTSEHQLLGKSWKMPPQKVITASFIFLWIKAQVRAAQETAGGTGPPGRGLLQASHSLMLQPRPTRAGSYGTYALPAQQTYCFWVGLLPRQHWHRQQDPYMLEQRQSGKILLGPQLYCFPRKETLSEKYRDAGRQIKG